MIESTGDSAPSVLLATSNAGKRLELQSILGGGVIVRTLDELGISSPAETGTTFAENAVLKAENGARLSGLLTLGDDSGLAVAALGGAPGIQSARFAGEPANDAKNRELLLHRLRDVPVGSRSATFVCAVALATPERLLGIVEGTCSGKIASEERGENGFGYDSLFELQDGRTMAELTLAEKNQVSHRAEALRRALPLIEMAISQGRR